MFVFRRKPGADVIDGKDKVGNVVIRIFLVKDFRKKSGSKFGLG